MKDSFIYDKAFKFSVRIYKLSKHLKSKNEFEIAKQILRSGTSIGANLAESRGTVSDSDFSNKLSISYKEALETKYWLDLLLEIELLEKKNMNQSLKIQTNCANYFGQQLKRQKKEKSKNTNKII